MYFIKLNFLLFVLFSFSQSGLVAQQKTNSKSQNEELGKVQWYRNYDEAVAIAKRQNKDIVLLFQEVPGCSTCRNYGHNVLSNPLIVEALENSFIPLAIFNNKGGHDRDILQKFGEPSWNNPVVRIINTEGKNLTPRIGGDYSAKTLCKRMKEALILSNKTVPLYIEILEQELNAKNSSSVDEMNFKMYCFWTGEKQLGKVDGVLDVESGFANHSEVVKVKYDSKVVSKEDLVSYGKKQGFVPTEKSLSYTTAASDVHYYLAHSIYRYLPLSEIQKTKINSALGSSLPAEKYLSPQQLKWLNHLKTNKSSSFKSLMNQKIEKAWVAMNSIVGN